MEETATGQGQDFSLTWRARRLY